MLKLMKTCKYSSGDTSKIDLGTKIIYKYPTPTKLFDVGLMVVKGRHPEDPKTFILETDCSLVMYITTGAGHVFLGDDTFQMESKDVIFVPANHKFAVEGKFEYVTFDSPAFYPEQSTEITD
jgi:mannose-6-phosphate isomerase-like protein (cupin superfamily)